eukprot:TRINITY_DN3868_c0_g1_i1.p1 TRINITY_DN3868_c0_g1~~TRINITY_DN3868_c0_g1_i1.p1  ORF type:complete len:210 (-),score=41.13 TRINITY_DN3868_c0_g1_i1:88-717(-)
MGNVFTKRDTIEARHCVPLGLYPTTTWDVKLLRKYILEKRLAPIYKGQDIKSGDLEECPICFLSYPGGLNRTTCCKHSVCTECYIQVKKPNTTPTCPFCNSNQLTVVFNGPKSKEERDVEEKEQQKVIELQIKMRKEEEEEDRLRLSRSLPSPERQIPEPPPQRIPPPVEAHSFSYHDSINSNLPPEELEEMFIREAIRLSLMDNRSHT